MPAPTTIEANEAPPVKQGSTGFKMIQNHFENTDAKASSAHGSEVGGLPQQKHFKLRNYARASSPAGSARSSFSSRRVSSRRFGGGVFRSHSSSHRSEASRELMVQGESEFFGLMELMTKISWKSNSLKEIWTKLIAERDSYLSEMEKMEEQFEEYAEMIEQKDKEHNQHNHEHEERRQEISKLRLEVTAALASVTQNKKKLHDRDTELLSVRHELNEYRDSSARLREEKISIQTALDDTRSKLALSGGQCDDVRGQLEKSASNFRNINQKYVELQSTHRELNSKHESTRAELVSLTQLSSSLKKEKHDWLREKGEIIENLRKSKHQYDEYVLKVKGVTEKHEKKIQELAKSKEIVSKLGYEKDELHQKVEELKRQLKEKHCKWEDSEDLGGKWKLKSEHSEREIISIREELKLHELEKTQLYETITKNREEIRQLTAEKERISEEFYHEGKKSEEHHRENVGLQESLRRLESQSKEKIEVVHSLTDRVKRLEVERYEATRKSGDLVIENEQLQTSIAGVKAELISLTGRYESVTEKLRECEIKYDEVCESYTEFHEDRSEFEFEMSNLRTMLREAREQKEKAISARNSADHERDEAMARYEEKCRQLERFEEEMSQHLHSQSQGTSESRRTTIHRYRESSSGNGRNGQSHSIQAD